MARRQCKYEFYLRFIAVIVIADFLYDTGIAQMVARWILEFLINHL